MALSIPPNKSLGAGDKWGRWVEEQLGMLARSQNLNSQSTTRAIKASNSAISALSGRVESIPIFTPYSTSNSNFSVASGSSFKTIASLEIELPEWKEGAQIMAISNSSLLTNNAPYLSRLIANGSYDTTSVSRMGITGADQSDSISGLYSFSRSDEFQTFKLEYAVSITSGSSSANDKNNVVLSALVIFP